MTKQNARSTSVRIVAVYVLVASLWIAFSDRVLLLLFQNAVHLTYFQTIKGLVFVAGTGGLLFILIRRNFEALTKWEEERNRLLKQEREARLEAERAIRVRDDFLAIASHELRTPLTPVLLYIQLARRHLNSVPAQVFPKIGPLLQALNNTDLEMGKLRRLVEDLLDTSRISSGHLVLNPEKTNLTELLEKVLEEFRPEFARAKVDVFTQVEAGVDGNVDPGRFRQVIENLISNAIKYGEGKAIEVELRKQNTQSTIEVRDRGIGISEELRHHVFERFGRVGTKESIGGLGLGLYISREIVKAHGGTIEVEARQGGGTVFRVVVPVLGS